MMPMTPETRVQAPHDVLAELLGDALDGYTPQECDVIYQGLDTLAEMLVSSWDEGIPGEGHDVYTEPSV